MSTSKRWPVALLGIGLSILFLTGCPSIVTTSTGSTAHLFAVDSKNGNVYEIDVNTATAAASPLVSIGQNAAGEIGFLGNVGFVAVGSYNNTAPGLYRFDASSASPSASSVGSTKISAQYICFVSSNLGYVSSADYWGAYASAVYPFDPSSPSSGFGAAVTGFPVGFYPQDIAYAGGRIYVADNKYGKVYRLNSAGTAVEASFATSAQGTTGLLAGIFNGKEGVFVANTGGYDASWNPLPGSIDFVSSDAADGATATVVLPNYSVGKLTAFDSTHLVATGFSKTYIVDLSGASPSAAEATFSKASFGSNDAAVLDGYAYVPDGANTVYRFSVLGNDVAKITVGKTGEYISNVGVRN